MTPEKFNFLVNEVITRNGSGQLFLASLVEQKEISKLDETKILIMAKIAILTKKMDDLCTKME